MAALTLGHAEAQTSRSRRGSTARAPGQAPSGHGATSDSTLDLPVARPKIPGFKTVNVPGLDPNRQYDLNLPPKPQPDPRDKMTPNPNPGDTPEDPMDPTDMGPPPTFFGEPIETETDTIFYVIDRSGSMSRDYQSFVNEDGMVTAGSKMDRSKAEIIKSIMGLGENFKFNILSYNCATTMWQRELKEANDTNKQSAIAWVREQVASGRTGTGPANALALSDKANMSVVLLTDGAPNCGADGFDGHRTMIRSQNTQGATINVFGIAASGLYRAFCQGVAGDSGGGYYDVP
jgi:hypothetical protein